MSTHFLFISFFASNGTAELISVGMNGWWTPSSQSYLDSHVCVGEDHIEVIVDHAELLPQLYDEILVHQVFLTQAIHWLIVLWGGERNTHNVHSV